MDVARQGQNEWWRYLLGAVLIAAGWLGSGMVVSLAAIVILELDGDPGTYVDLRTAQFVGVDPLVYFLVAVSSAVVLLVCLYVVVRFIHRRPFLSLVTPRPRFGWRRAAVGLGLFLLLSAGAGLVEALLYPGRYQLAFDAGEFFRFLPFLLVLLPVQTTAEELLFRGYLMQGLGLLTRHRWIAALVSSFVFMLMHLLNPEVGAGFFLMAAYYFLVGLFFALVTLRDDRLELAIGAHAAVDLFAGLLANYQGSVLPTPSIFYVTTLDPVYGLVSAVVAAALFYVLLFVRPRKAV